MQSHYAKLAVRRAATFFLVLGLASTAVGQAVPMLRKARPRIIVLTDYFKDPDGDKLSYRWWH